MPGPALPDPDSGVRLRRRMPLTPDHSRRSKQFLARQLHCHAEKLQGGSSLLTHRASRFFQSLTLPRLSEGGATAALVRTAASCSLTSPERGSAPAEKTSPGCFTAPLRRLRDIVEVIRYFLAATPLRVGRFVSVYLLREGFAETL